MNHLTATSSEGAQISTLPVRAIDDGAKNSIGKQGAASMTNGRSATDVKENHRQRMDETKSPILADHVYHDDDDDDGPATAAEQLNVTIVSARYAPCEGKRLLTGEWVEGHNPIPYTRDVTPFLRALLIAQKRREETKDSSVTATAVCNSDDGSCHVDHNNIDNDDTDDPRWVRLNALSGGQRRAQIRVLDPSFSMGMNGIFGDPIPGTSKRLHVHYIISETTTQTQLPPDSCGSASKRPRRLVQVANTAEAHTMSFAEHERVYLRRRWTVYRDQTDKLQDAAVRTATKSVNLHTVANEADLSTLRVARKMGRSQSISEFADVAVQQRTAEPPSVQWRLRSATSEVALPLVMVFLGVRDRVQCRLVCTVWRNIIREWGVATTIDDNDPTFPHFTRPFLRGILSHSYSSLQSLFLSGTSDIEPQDLHPAIPHLRNLRSLDISRCIHLDNSTMQLLAQHVSGTLEVLYMKGLRKVTDDGLISIARTCQSLKVIDISNIPVTDQAAIEVGAHLTQLRAIYMRDNYLLTNTSVDVITEKCILLEQLTLWGCTRLKHLSFDQHIDKTSIFTSGSLILLNLWGCHNLGDDTAHALQGMNQLRTLIVSECHRLTDSFVVSLRW